MSYYNAPKDSEEYIKDNMQVILDKVNILLQQILLVNRWLIPMEHADFYPLLLKDAKSCIIYAMEVANDKDGYEGIQFCRCKE